MPRKSSRSYRRRRKPRKTQAKYIRKAAGENTGPRSIVESISQGVGQVAKLAGVVAPIIAAINTERKYFDQSASSTPTGPGLTGGGIQNVFTPVQGTGDSNIVGNSCLMQDWQMRILISKAVNNSLTTPIMGGIGRVMLFLWKENAVVNSPTVAKIFETPSNFFSPLNKDNSDQIVVIKDKFFAINPGASYSKADVLTTYTPYFNFMKIYKKLGVHARFTDAAAPTLNQLYIFTACSATDGCNYTWYSRVNFTDN